MLLMGDELSRSQHGNNNAYAQDNETSWLDWIAGREMDPELVDFVRRLVAIRRGTEAFRRRSFVSGHVLPQTRLKEVYWLAPEGREMAHDDWADATRRTIGVQLGNHSRDVGRFLMLLNAADEDVTFHLAQNFPAKRFIHSFDTRYPEGLVRGSPAVIEPGGTFVIASRSLALFQHSSLGSPA